MELIAADHSLEWKQANEYCLDRGWEFLVLTEKDLGLEQYG